MFTSQFNSVKHGGLHVDGVDGVLPWDVYSDLVVVWLELVDLAEILASGVVVVGAEVGGDDHHAGQLAGISRGCPKGSFYFKKNLDLVTQFSKALAFPEPQCRGHCMKQIDPE